MVATEPGDLVRREDPATDPVLHRARMRLSYADCDPAGILYYATWFPWMERVQSEWFFLSGLRQDTLRDRFGFWTVTRHAECEYLHQVRMFDTIDIELRFGGFSRTSLTFETHMRWLEGDVLAARGAITVVCVDSDSTPIPVPDQIRAALPGA